MHDLDKARSALLGVIDRRARRMFFDRCRNDPNAFVEAMLRSELWMPSPRTSPPIDWSNLPSEGELVMVAAGRAMSGKTPW